MWLWALWGRCDFCFSFTASQPGFSSRCRLAAERARGSGWWEIIQRAGDTLPALLNHMRVNHRGGQIGMSQQFLDRADVRAPLQQVRCEAVPEGVRADYLGQSCSARHHFNGLVRYGSSIGGAAGRCGPDRVTLALVLDIPFQPPNMPSWARP